MAIHAAPIGRLRSRRKEDRIGDFTKLAVWQRARELAVAVHRATSGWPGEEIFGLVAQTRRAAYSVAANIAEGCGRNGDAELARFVRIAMGSAAELSCLLTLALDAGYLSLALHDQLQQQVGEVRRMLSSLERRVNTSRNR